MAAAPQANQQPVRPSPTRKAANQHGVPGHHKGQRGCKPASRLGSQASRPTSGMENVLAVCRLRSTRPTASAPGFGCDCRLSRHRQCGPFGVAGTSEIRGQPGSEHNSGQRRPTRSSRSRPPTDGAPAGESNASRRSRAPARAWPTNRNRPPAHHDSARAVSKAFMAYLPIFPSLNVSLPSLSSFPTAPIRRG